MDISVTSRFYVILANFYNTLLFLMKRLIHEKKEGKEQKNCLIFLMVMSGTWKENKPFKRFPAWLFRHAMKMLF